MELNDNQQWYVRSMVIRGIMALEDNIAEGKKYLETDPPETFRQSVEGMVAYSEQLLREAKDYIPEELQPR